MFATYDAFIARSQSTEDIVAASVEALKKNPPDRLPYLHAIDRTINREGWEPDEINREQQWNKLAVDLINEGNPKQAEWVYDYLESVYGIRFFIYNYIAVLYRNRSYSRIVELASKEPLVSDWKRRIEPNDIEGIFDRIKGWSYIAGATMKKGDLEETIRICELVLSDIPDMPYTVNDNIFVNGLRLQLRFLQQLAFNPALIPDDNDFDPLTTQVDTVKINAGRAGDHQSTTTE